MPTCESRTDPWLIGAWMLLTILPGRLRDRMALRCFAGFGIATRFPAKVYFSFMDLENTREGMFMLEATLPKLGTERLPLILEVMAGAEESRCSSTGMKS